MSVVRRWLHVSTDAPARVSARVQLGTCLKRSFSVILKAMEVHFTPEQEAQLAQMATNAGTAAEQLVKDVVLRLLEEQPHVRDRRS